MPAQLQASSQALQSPPSLVQPQPTAQPAGPPPGSRRFDDYDAARRQIFDDVLAAASALQPVQNQQYTLQLANVGYEGPERYSLADQKKALLSGGTLIRRLRGDWQLIDNATQKVLDQRRTTVAAVPYLTSRGTYVMGGNDYTLANQLRPKAGIYTRQKENGEFEAHVNTLPGKGFAHRIVMDPKTGVFRMVVAQSRIPLVSLMRGMGVPEETLQKAWGPLYAANSTADSKQDLTKLYTKFVRNADPNADIQTKQRAVADAIQAMAVDPAVVKRTLGQSFSNLGPDAYLNASKKLLAISNGAQKPDDRDALAFQRLMGPEDLFSERINKAGTVMRKALWKAARNGTLKGLPAGLLTPLLREVLTTSGLANPLEEVNTAELLDQNTRVTKLGYGGISGTRSIPLESRMVQPSYLGYVDFLRSPESEAVGVDSRLASNAIKGRDGKIYTQLRDTKTGQLVYKAADELDEDAIAFPGELGGDDKRITAIRGGAVARVPRDQVRYELPGMEAAMSPLSNLVPLKSNAKGHRAIMASRMITQALPLVGAQAQLVQNRIPGQEKSYAQEYAKFMGAVRATQGGRVADVTPDGIKVKYDDGSTGTIETYSNFPLNRKTAFTQTPLVQAGDRFEADQLLARSNFTDEQGSTALGINARTAYVPYHGRGFEDAIIISKSMAKRMTSEHLYQDGHEWGPSDKRGRRDFVSLFPGVYEKSKLEPLDDDGVIKPGTTVKYGDPLVLVAREKPMTGREISRGRKTAYSNNSVTWDHHDDGVVTDVVKTDKGIQLAVTAKSQFKDGDKMSGLYGDKGVAMIVDDEKMPKDAQGRPFEVLLNPLSLASRVNPSQKFEAVLGKLAEMLGKPYQIEDWKKPGETWEFIKSELAQHGLKDKEDIVDPETGRTIKNVLTGSRYFMKLHHVAEGKRQGRSIGAYTAEGTPMRGGDSGGKSKRLGLLETNALLSHGALQVLRDAKLIRGQSSPDFWSQVASGFPPPMPKVPLVYQKFVANLQAAGINPVRTGRRVQLLAMTDKDVEDRAGDREITNSETVDWKDPTKGIPGGLFDPRATGWPANSQWSFIKLHEPMPNPVFEEPIRKLLGLTGKAYTDVLAGREQFRGLTGPAAIGKALDSIDLDAALETTRNQLYSAKKSARDVAVKRLGYLKAAKETGVHPRDWMLSKVPVLPPQFRPVSVMGNKKLPLVPDSNFLYKELLDANNNLKGLSKDLGDDVGEERLQVYNAFKAVTGLGEPTHPKNQERQVKGLLAQVFGNSPKYGSVQFKLLSNTADLVGRSTVVPEPDLNMDEVGIPEESAWEVYKPLIVRNLVQEGVPRLAAASYVKDRAPLAKRALLNVMGSRPVFVTRAPVLHRYGVMAFWPKLVTGSNIRVSPLVVGGFGMDFDGDASNFHVIADEAAGREAAEKMLPSKNLIGVSTLRDPMYVPTQEYVSGLYAATNDKKAAAPVRTFSSVRDVLSALRRGDIDHDDPVEIIDK